ncbi:uncharacterized protein JN550_003507 [Neoarthrinium moseri]|nr:uncharacterized protein JN550_003507 [Neoarthrinium moseri]KAI1873254.1 hypothetical protein JN550_003507 [Neoarthrinium moseri]
MYRFARRAYNAADGAVEGMLAAAVVYTAVAMILNCCLKNGGPKILRWLLVLGDILFMGAFIAVAALTRPNHGPAGPHGSECQNDTFAAGIVSAEFRRRHNCNLPWGTFILAIISTILHFLTALFHQVRDHRKADRREADRLDSNAVAGDAEGYGKKERKSHHSSSTV